MDWLVQKNPQNSQALKEAKEVFINNGCDMKILKTMTREEKITGGLI